MAESAVASSSLASSISSNQASTSNNQSSRRRHSDSSINSSPIVLQSNVLTSRKKCLKPLAPRFKHQEMYCWQDIGELRHRLKLNFAKLDKEMQEFEKPHLDRILTDDWLASRYLYKGAKMAKKSKNAKESLPSSTLSPVVHHTLKLIEKTSQFHFDYQLNGTQTPADFPAEWTEADGLLVGGKDYSGNSTMYFRLSLYKPKLLINAYMKQQFKRFICYVSAKADEQISNCVGSGIAFVFDFSSVSYENYDIEIISWLVDLQNNFGPKMQAYTMIYNLPWLFNVPFKFICKALIKGSNR